MEFKSKFWKTCTSTVMCIQAYITNVIEQEREKAFIYFYCIFTLNQAILNQNIISKHLSKSGVTLLVPVDIVRHGNKDARSAVHTASHAAFFHI